ncbi:MAG: T9SS type A sorting domain-containing protein [Saprospiraceae bacterium]|nr:T9SS type A sorting domain-containing protein [Saprospiraceae bacterium]
MKKALLFSLFVSLAVVALAQDHRPENAGCEPGGTPPPYSSESYVAPFQAASLKVDYLIYPNPATDFFSLDEESTEKGTARTINVYNLLGQRVRTFQVERGQRYSIGDLQGGLYLAQFLDANGKVIMTRRLQKANSVIRP